MCTQWNSVMLYFEEWREYILFRSDRYNIMIHSIEGEVKVLKKVCMHNDPAVTQ